MTAGEDHIAIRSQVIGDRLPGGAVDAFYFHLDAAAGTSSQFVYRATAEAGVSELIWDSNGAACGGELLIALFLGDPVLTVADLTIYQGGSPSI